MASNVSEARQVAFIDLEAQQARIRPQIDAAIKRVLDHGQYIMGPEIAEFEGALAALTGAKHVISCASGTDALLIGMMALGLKPGDAVLCPGFTYTATPEAIALLGATPIFIDVDEDDFNLDPDNIAAGIAVAKEKGLNPVGLIAVDLFGLPADYDAIRAAAGDMWIMADAAQSLGASTATGKVGTFGTITATSFFPAKPLGCYGDGGAILTDDANLAAICESIRLHGRSTVDKYDIERIGVNGRLDTLQAAILLQKLAIFEEEIELRQAVARRYNDALADVAQVPVIWDDAVSVWAQYTLKVPAHRRDAVMTALKAKGVPTAVYYPRPLHHQGAYRHYPFTGNGLPVSEGLSSEVMSLPMHPYLAEDEQHYIIACVREALETA
ncbi:DegT/DnrJ/EryC1/StrS aminotransferase family protein [Sphingomonas sp. G-3-2-10]|uniref:DegT/DnrJ/EryC1/StrS family aminotransferase n=1 Tax=Sphingomonas sp. G-3-2-10 TaxID=2728838 RepID=UPI00146A5D3C|nr:DegT/DnrJ/EryC1/StrS aminotransferase family protein [Sphingomonas sp. G-3-2-10]NML06246.1 DegT/DnrJ/EryC1/StrS aminotransferase family protein [Sphingomonas sp. G-3-2-10]